MSIPDLRELYEQLLDYKGERPYQEVLLPWKDKADHAMTILRNYGDGDAKHLFKENIIEHLWDLYALSRVSDILLLPFQKGESDSWPGPNIKPDERNAYLLSLGMMLIEQKTFHPFFHEIVEVIQSSDSAEPISVDKILWSGFMLGSLLFCRAGVRVRGGSEHIKKEIAEKSTLYFTFWRRNRPVSDLSHGWGSNSQWRTCFRRDYEDDTSFFYNVDGKMNATLPSTETFPNPSREDLTSQERLELLVNRCLIVTERPHEDLWPFDDVYMENKNQRI